MPSARRWLSLAMNAEIGKSDEKGIVGAFRLRTTAFAVRTGKDGKAHLENSK